MKEKLLEILIPTLNRDKELIDNLKSMQDMIIRNNLSEEIGIIISDNNSTEESFSNLKTYLDNDYHVDYQLYRQDINIGIEKNTLFLLKKSAAKYVMTLGDDDYFTEGFLLLTLEYIRTGEYTGIIPNYYEIENGKRTSVIRDEIGEDKIIDKSSLYLSDRGHELSCLVFLREGVLDAYLKNVRPNAYPFVYFVGYNLSRGKMVYVTREPFARTNIPKKNWDYSFDNLMSEFTIVLDCLPYADEKDKKHQLQRTFEWHKWRFCTRKTAMHPIKMINRISNYAVSNTTKKVVLETYLKYLGSIPVRKIKRFVIH